MKKHVNKWTREYRQEYMTKYRQTHITEDLRFLGQPRKEILDRFNHTCHDCHGTNKKLDIHHIDKTGYSTVKDFSLVNNASDNLVALCRKCHRKRHLGEFGINLIPPGKWSMKYEKCFQCGTTEIKHKIYGYCEKCWKE